MEELRLKETYDKFVELRARKALEKRISNIQVRFDAGADAEEEIFPTTDCQDFKPYKLAIKESKVLRDVPIQNMKILANMQYPVELPVGTELDLDQYTYLVCAGNIRC